jgi:hypothetical protein
VNPSSDLRTPIKYRPQRDHDGVITLHRVRHDGTLDPEVASPYGERLSDLQRQVDAMRMAIMSARKVEILPPVF